ncbi:ubiquinol-cytochrome c reductase complex assembly factor 2 [Aspergillus homomorphus CBS 101889]|uniref:Uncharacterized protein n=1 Tax=Aspergillus homomorphus (strain CBS 101889) TaxID=1450537 RepID=A0A395HLI3_ASPHC|nr:hypothetical protein BO97DRAFT_428655 [Aspergillus homomorphus CBS 101889]RAL08085.1 hypothetical protein BO97DRAFT_428655 [Aspergillus homomorphus CBS 101889]
MAKPTPSTTTRLTHLLKHWPTDKVRPASVSVQTYLQSRLHPQQPQNGKKAASSQQQQQPAAAAAAAAGLSQASLNALTSLLEDRYARRYPLPPSLRHPASNPQHYENVIREFDEAPDRDWFGRLRKRVAGMLRLK